MRVLCLKNVENILGGVILLVKLQVSACNLTIFTFFKLYKCYQTCKASHLQERNFFFSSQTVFSGLIRALSFIKNFWMKIDYINIFFFSLWEKVMEALQRPLRSSLNFVCNVKRIALLLFGLKSSERHSSRAKEVN